MEKYGRITGKDELKYRAYKFSLEAVRFVSSLSKSRINDILTSQFLRCATSVGANIVEAQGGSSKKDFINFFCITLKSANECKFWLCLMRDAKIGRADRLDNLLSEATAIAKILGKSILTMRGNG